MEAQDASQAARWLVLADVVYLAGGAIAYATTVSAVLLAVFSLVVAMPGIIALRHAVRSREAHLWADRALSAATGTFTVAAMLVLIPYMAAEGGRSLWSQEAFAAIGLAVVALGTLLWNAAALQAISSEPGRGSTRSYAAFHALLLVAAVVLALTGDGAPHLVTFRGEVVPVHDLQTAPAVAAVPCLVWAMALWRARGASVQARG